MPKSRSPKRGVARTAKPDYLPVDDSVYIMVRGKIYAILPDGEVEKSPNRIWGYYDLTKPRVRMAERQEP